MIVMVLFKVIASTYLQCATKLLKKFFFVTDVYEKVTLICFQVLQDFVTSTSFGTKELVVIMSQHLKG